MRIWTCFVRFSREKRLPTTVKLSSSIINMCVTVIGYLELSNVFWKQTGGRSIIGLFAVNDVFCALFVRNRDQRLRLNFCLCSWEVDNWIDYLLLGAVYVAYFEIKWRTLKPMTWVYSFVTFSFTPLPSCIVSLLADSAPADHTIITICPVLPKLISTLIMYGVCYSTHADPWRGVAC